MSLNFPTDNPKINYLQKNCKGSEFKDPVWCIFTKGEHLKRLKFYNSLKVTRLNSNKHVIFICL